MIKEALYVVQFIFGLDKARNQLEVFPDDTFIVSFPKSGNTWTRFLIGNLAYDDGVDFSNINRRVPDPEALSKRFLKGLPRPRILKSHQPFDPRYQRIIFIVRDPRDVVLSNYHHGIKMRDIEEGFPIDRYVANFVSGVRRPDYGTWGENVGSWLAARRNSKRFHSGTFLLLRYEDLLDEPEAQLERVAQFLGIEHSSERIARAVDRSSADRMRQLEKSQSLLWALTSKSRQDKPFVRAAKAGNWKKELPDDCIRLIESSWGGLMKEIGYPLRFGKMTELEPAQLTS